MHICIIGANDALEDPRALVSRHVLEQAGHKVTLVTAGPNTGHANVISVRRPRRSLLSRVVSKLSSVETLRRQLTDSLSIAAIQVAADLYLPTDMRAVEAAVLAASASDALVVRTPKMPDLGDVDLINVAPADPERAEPVAGLGINHTPADHRPPYRPQDGRHRSRRVVLCYRRSEINPGRYVEAALRRSGADLRVETERIDLSTVAPGTDFVLFVEGPYPALDVTGETDVPTLFWAHHGEHHLHANLRLADRYRADAVLLAHSWHLAFWFPASVHRFPFGLADDLLDPSRRLPERTYDVAMVGAGLRGGGQYGRRQQLVEALDKALPADRLAFRERVSAREMADLYADCRIVINEGGTRHFPITMRVFEAVGSGAVLLSERLPGMDMITPYEQLSADVASDVQRILDDLDTAQKVTDSALASALDRHTYGHRVDELFAIASATPKRMIPATTIRSPLARVIDRDVQTQRVAQLNAPELAAELPSREIWDAAKIEPRRLAPGKMETVALRKDKVDDVTHLLRSARRFIYIDGAADISEYLIHERPDALLSENEGIQRVDTMAPSYRIMDFESTRP